MNTFKQFLSEHIISIGLDPSQEKLRTKFRKQIFKILQTSYASPEIGGYGKLKSGSDEEERAINDDINSSIIKATIRDGAITAVALYKKQHGRKCIASGTNGTRQGLVDFKKNKLEDFEQERAWAEVSGKPEKMMRAMGAPVVPSSKAKELLGKDVSIIDDEYYSRKMGKDDAKKIILGYPK